MCPREREEPGDDEEFEEELKNIVFFKVVVVGEDNWETVMVLVGLVKGLETVWEELIWPYLTVLYPRADLSLLTCC